jgi:catechol 2,3-dioxygenase-like lactoylglutathione lyase family enzyme
MRKGKAEFMDRSANFVTVATADLDAARTFYVDGLGWSPLLDVPGEILFFQVGYGMTLGLFKAENFAADLGAAAGSALPVTGVTLSQNVGSSAEVDQTVATAKAAGAIVVKAPQPAAFGGYHGHFADPNGLIWEIAYNPGWSVDADGTVRLVAVE